MKKLGFRRRFYKTLMLLVSLLLVVTGIGSIALLLMGRSTTAKVINYKQVLYIDNDVSTRDSRRYELTYQFTADGKQYVGSVTRIFKGGTHMRETMPVRFLNMWPEINDEDGSKLNFSGIFLVALGAFLFVITLRNP